jgi:hypothetical protein
MMPADNDPLTMAGYAPCLDTGDDPAAPVPCGGRAMPTSAAWVGPGLLLASYGESDCGHTTPTVFLLIITADDLADGEPL